MIAIANPRSRSPPPQRDAAELQTSPKGTARRAARCPPSARNRTWRCRRKICPRPRFEITARSGWPRARTRCWPAPGGAPFRSLHQRLGELARVADGEEQRDAGEAGARTAREARRRSLDCDRLAHLTTQRERLTSSPGRPMQAAITAHQSRDSFFMPRFAFGGLDFEGFCSPDRRNRPDRDVERLQNPPAARRSVPVRAPRYASAIPPGASPAPPAPRALRTASATAAGIWPPAGRRCACSARSCPTNTWYCGTAFVGLAHRSLQPHPGYVVLPHPSAPELLIESLSGRSPSAVVSASAIRGDCVTASRQE